MRRRRRATIEDLRLAIDCLPVVTRRAMLEGIRCNEIIVGGYTDRDGGVCPMLAAHRAGGRTNFIYFAKAWDRFAGAGDRSRRATGRELLILTTHLEASLLDEAGPAPDLARAMAEHRDLLARRGQDRDRARRRADSERRPGEREAGGGGARRPGDPDRSSELRHRPGWAWMRIFRRYDEYERALRRLSSEHDEVLGEGEQPSSSRTASGREREPVV